jgi:hypothetical protein
MKFGPIFSRDKHSKNKDNPTHPPTYSLPTDLTHPTHLTYLTDPTLREAASRLAPSPFTLPLLPAPHILLTNLAGRNKRLAVGILKQRVITKAVAAQGQPVAPGAATPEAHVWSSLPLTIVVPSGLKATELTENPNGLERAPRSGCPLNPTAGSFCHHCH